MLGKIPGMLLLCASSTRFLWFMPLCCCLGLGQSHLPQQMHFCSLSREKRWDGTCLFMVNIPHLLQGTTAQQEDREPPGRPQQPERIHIKHSPKGAPQSDAPASASQTSVHPFGTSPGPGVCSALPVPVARCQPAPCSRSPPGRGGGMLHAR